MQVSDSILNPQFEFAFEARVVVDQPLIVGESSRGLRRMVPIIGGTFAGPDINGRVLASGADWQFVRPDGVLEVMAKYTLETDDGILIAVDNRGVRHASTTVMERLTRGDAVDADEYYFRTAARFEAPLNSRYASLNRMLFIGVAERQPAAAIVRFFAIK